MRAGPDTASGRIDLMCGIAEGTSTKAPLSSPLTMFGIICA
jgi:hypothetical protein